MSSDDIKKIVISLGADLCKIAGIERFEDAPEGYHPRDVLIVVYANFDMYSPVYMGS